MTVTYVDIFGHQGLLSSVRNVRPLNGDNDVLVGIKLIRENGNLLYIYIASYNLYVFITFGTVFIDYG